MLAPQDLWAPRKDIPAMNFASSNPQLTVEKTGAAAGSVLRGVVPTNMGLRVRISQEQKRGNPGPVVGPFVILDVGENKHGAFLAALLRRPTDAQEVVGVIRHHCPGCVNVVNGNILVLEGPGAPPDAARGG